MQIQFAVDDYRIMVLVLKLMRTTVFPQESDFKPWLLGLTLCITNDKKNFASR